MITSCHDYFLFPDAMQEQRVAEDSKKREAFKEFKDQMQRDLVVSVGVKLWLVFLDLKKG